MSASSRDKKTLAYQLGEALSQMTEEGVVGADAIFACLGPALEIFSRYSRVEKASGEVVPLKEYLEQVWAAVAKEALTMIFTGADATGFEEDARLTAMWLWTVNAGKTDAANDENADEEATEDESEGGAKKVKITGFVLEYDAARKIAQGLGAHLEDLASLVAVYGETARLLPVAERARTLFGKDEGKAATVRASVTRRWTCLRPSNLTTIPKPPWRNEGRKHRQDCPGPRPPKHDPLRRQPRRSLETFPGRRRRRQRPTFLAPRPGPLRPLPHQHG